MDELFEKVELTVDTINEPARAEVVKDEDEKFFAYEKQKSHN